MKTEVFVLRDPDSNNDHIVYQIDLNRRMAWSGEQRRPNLSAREWEVLRYFLAHPRQVISRGKLLDLLGRGPDVAPPFLDQIISSLRDVFDGWNVVETVYKRGYRLNGKVEILVYDPAPNAVAHEHLTVEKSEFHANAAADADFDIRFDPDFAPEEVKDILTALADYYRSCGGAGFELDLESQEAMVTEPVHV